MNDVCGQKNCQVTKAFDKIHSLYINNLPEDLATLFGIKKQSLKYDSVENHKAKRIEQCTALTTGVTRRNKGWMHRIKLQMQSPWGNQT